VEGLVSGDLRYANPPARHTARVLRNQAVAPGVFDLWLERGGLTFRAGHEILLHGQDVTEERQYSLAGGEQEEALRLLYRVIPGGLVSPRLAALVPGDSVSFTGPFGSFLIRDFLAPMVFIATGTGIAPALSFVRSHPGLDLTVLQGARTAEDLFFREEFSAATYHACVSRAPGPGHFPGRVTARLESLTFPEDAHYYLCGANDMILAVRRQLKARGVKDACIFSEAYYFW
jgi:ferredoxin-NADP reductase